MFVGCGTLLLFLCRPTVPQVITPNRHQGCKSDWIVRSAKAVYDGLNGPIPTEARLDFMFTFPTLILPLTIIRGLFGSLLHYSCACAPILRQDQPSVTSNKLVQTKRRQPPFMEQMSLPA